MGEHLLGTAGGGRRTALQSGCQPCRAGHAGLLIITGYHSIKSARIKDVWATGWSGRVVMLVTLTLTLSIPLQWAVFLGVLLSIIVHFFVTSSDEVRV